MSIASQSLERFPVLGIPVHLHDNYSHWLTDRLEDRVGTHVVTLNSEMVMLAQQDQTVAALIRQADLVIPDGAGIVLYLRLRDRRIPRCPGIELVETLLQRLDGNHPVFFYGGKPGVAAAAAQRWQDRSPQLAIAGTQHGYLRPEEEEHLTTTLQASQPHLILVGLGVPGQEQWICQHRHLCPQATWVGVGGSFDIWAGLKSRAPNWLRDNHLEWVYRLYQEPWRWQRMLALPRFAWQALWERSCPLN